MDYSIEKIAVIINEEKACQCHGLASATFKTGWIRPKKLLFAIHEQRFPIDDFDKSCLHELDELNRIATLFRSHPDYAAPKTFMENIKGLVNSDNFNLLQ